jgi:DNA polymerase-3 subunit beta
MTNEKFRSVRVIAGNGSLKSVVKTPEVGEIDTEIPSAYQGEPVEIAFNPAFILDVLRNIAGDKVCLLLKDTSSPGVIKPYTDAPQDNYINVVMPIRI